MAAVGPAMDQDRRINAVRAFRALPAEDRREALALARQGRRHPDERVAAVSWWYAAAVLQPRWWNRVHPVVLPLAGMVVACLGLVLDSWPLTLVALLLVLAGGLAWWQRSSTAPLLVVGLRPASTAGAQEPGEGGPGPTVPTGT